MSIFGLPHTFDSEESISEKKKRELSKSFVVNVECPHSSFLQYGSQKASSQFILWKSSNIEAVLLWAIWPTGTKRPKDTDISGSQKKQPIQEMLELGP